MDSFKTDWSKLRRISTDPIILNTATVNLSIYIYMYVYICVYIYILASVMRKEIQDLVLWLTVNARHFQYHIVLKQEWKWDVIYFGLSQSTCTAAFVCWTISTIVRLFNVVKVKYPGIAECIRLASMR